MLLDLIKYFAKYPDKEGVLPLFTRGESTVSGYSDLLTYMNALPETSVLPELKRFVLAASFNATKAFISGFVSQDKYLLLDYGEITSRLDGNNRLNDSFALAITVARRLGDSTDLAEQSLASVDTLDCINKLRAHILADQDNGILPANIKQLIAGQHTFVPFDAPELQSVGWTLTFSLDATDGLGASDLKLIYRKQ